MSIERTSPLKPVSSVQPRDASDVQTSKARTEKSEQATSSSVTLSDAQSKLMQPGSSDINQARVDAIKTAIKNGDLKMDSGKIADALIQEAKSYLQE